MNKTRLNYISFSEMREIVEQRNKDNVSLPYMRGDIGMFFSGNPTLANILQTGVPYILEEPRIGMIRRGRARVMINMIERELGENTLAFLSKGTVVQAEWFSQDFEMCGVMTSNERVNIVHGIPASNLETGAAQVMIIPVAADDAALAYRMFGVIWELIHQDELIDEAINFTLQSLICYYKHLFRRAEPAPGTRTPHTRAMFERFIALINEHCREQHALGFYAGKLCVTTRYLGIVVKNTSGITAKEWLDRALTTSAKVLLRHTDRQINEIADALHFPATSFFCKFFRRMTGLTPQSYRAEKHPQTL
ncbi:MAG: helix-turn-helix transcriptional regulator [Prevotella sp.]|nr:helix-turn-helix transcriptional regulator [Prevotella sp.]